MKFVLEFLMKKLGRGGLGKLITGAISSIILFSFILNNSPYDHKVKRDIVVNLRGQHGFLSNVPESIADNNNKILCYVLLEENKIRVGKLIKETWGRRCDELLFFGNFVTNELPVIKTNVTEGYEFLWGKSKATLKYMSQHFSHKYDWFLKADDDTFIILENLRDFISEVKVRGPVWFGFKMKHRKMTEGYMSGGAGYVFNSKALRKVAKIFKENVNASYYKYDNKIHKGIGCRTVDNRGIEDIELGRCFVAANVGDISTLDSEGRERFLPLSLSSVMSGNVSPFHWVWQQAWNKFKTGKNCCSPQLISIHEVGSSQLRILDFIIYQLKPNVRSNWHTKFDRKN